MEKPFCLDSYFDVAHKSDRQHHANRMFEEQYPVTSL
jgi:hypothetical protein